jgi:hypothetical protein
VQKWPAKEAIRSHRRPGQAGQARITGEIAYSQSPGLEAEVERAGTKNKTTHRERSVELLRGLYEHITRGEKMKHPIFCLIVIGIMFASCRSNKEVVRVSGSRPKYADNKIELQNLYTIDVTRINMFSRETSRGFDNVIDFDANNNMYILDSFESTISVFDKNGRFVRSFGGAGQGPGEFSSPSMLFIKDEEIYVLQGFGFDFKIVNLEGEFLATKRVGLENPLRYYASGKDIYLFSGKVDRTFTKLEFILRRLEGGRFDKDKVLLTCNYSPGLNGPNYDFIWPNWLYVDDSGEFYFPEDNLNEYSIIKYTRDGKPELIFGRKYDVREYTKKARDRFYSIFGRQIETGMMKFPQSPPVVRKMFQDQKKNIWVVSGETSEDNEDPDFDNTIDVFSGKGEWLRSLKSKSISRNCLYNDGRIYCILPINSETYEQFIEVYGIKY